MSVPGVAVLGTGDRAREQLTTITRLSRVCRLVGVCGSDAARAAETGAAFGVPGFADLDRMLAETTPAILYVATPPDAHHAAVEIAGRRGVHVISETPIATTLPMASAMIESANRHHIKLEVAENVWRWPEERLKRLIIEAGVIGDVRQVHLSYFSGSYHGISAARTLIGREPVRVRGFARETAVPPYADASGRVHDSGPFEHGLIDFEGGAICVYQYPLHPHFRNAWDVMGTKGAILGSDLMIWQGGQWQVFPIRREVDNSTAPSALVRVFVETSPEIAWENPYRSEPIGADADDIARADILVRFLEAVSTDAEPEYGAPPAHNDQEVLVALRESARRDGVWVDLPLIAMTEGERQVHRDYSARYGHDPLKHADAVLRTRHPPSSPAELARQRYDDHDDHDERNRP